MVVFTFLFSELAANITKDRAAYAFGLLARWCALLGAYTNTSLPYVADNNHTTYFYTVSAQQTSTSSSLSVSPATETVISAPSNATVTPAHSNITVSAPSNVTAIPAPSSTVTPTPALSIASSISSGPPTRELLNSSTETATPAATVTSVLQPALTNSPVLLYWNPRDDTGGALYDTDSGGCALHVGLVPQNLSRNCFRVQIADEYDFLFL